MKKLFLLFLLVPVCLFGQYFYHSKPKPSTSTNTFQLALNYAVSQLGIVEPSSGYHSPASALTSVIDNNRIDHFLLLSHDAEEFALINLLDPDSNRAVNDGASFISDTGYVANSNGVGINTKYRPSTDAGYLRHDSLTIGIWLQDISSSTSYTLGVNTSYDILVRYLDGNVDLRLNTTTSHSIAADLNGQSGLLIIQRIGNMYSAYFNEAFLGSVTGNSDSGLPTGNIYLHTMNNGGYAVTSRHPIRAFFIGGYLNSSQISDVFNAFIEYQDQTAGL